MIEIPDTLGWWRDRDGGDAWLARLPRIVAACADRWALTIGAPVETVVSLVVPATRADGSHAFLKVNFPEQETECEADALAAWGGVGAARLLEHDEGDRALLVERLVPGDRLWGIDDEPATEIAASVLRLLHVAPPTGHRFTPLAEPAARWVDEIPRDWEALGRPFERLLVDVAVDACRTLPGGDGEVILHQDLHGANVLRDGDGWRAIDPKPLVGDPAFDGASLLRDRRWEIDARMIRRRLDQLAESLELDRERLRLWGVAHALAWGIDEREVLPEHVECARILAAL